MFREQCSPATVDKGGANKVGPEPVGAVNRPKLRHAGFGYLPVLEAKGDWSYEDDHMITIAYVRGTKMVPAGLPGRAGSCRGSPTWRTMADNAPAPLP